MPRTHFSPKPGRFGVAPAFLSVSPTITANTAVETHLGGFHRKAYLYRLNMSCQTVPADADGTITAVFYKRDASADADVTLTGSFDLEASLVADESVQVDLSSSLTEAQRTLDEGDVLFVIITSNSAAIDTAAANLRAVAEVGVKE